jgi:hypothetical protein
VPQHDNPQYTWRCHEWKTLIDLRGIRIVKQIGAAAFLFRALTDTSAIAI